MSPPRTSGYRGFGVLGYECEGLEFRDLVIWVSGSRGLGVLGYGLYLGVRRFSPLGFGA